MGIIVTGEGPPNAKIMLIGQNPGREEAEQGGPFVGRSGRYLDAVLKRNNIDRSTLYITNIVKETTPGNRRPTAQEIGDWMPYLLEETRRVKPEIVVLMGNVARKTPRLEGIEYIETCHPAAAMRFPKAREKFESDFAKLKEKMSKPNGGEEEMS